MEYERTLAELAEDEPSTFRECAEKFLHVLHSAVSRMPDSPQKWGIAFATANPICLGRSITEVAAKLGYSRATISYEARKFCDETGLPPSSYMKSDEAVSVAQEARRMVVKIRTTIQQRNQT